MPIISFKGKTPRIGKNVFIAPTATIIGDVTIGDNSSIWFNTVLRGDMSPIVIGKYTNIQDDTTIHVMPTKSTVIGNYVTIGHNVVMHCDKAEDNCLVGMGSVLLGMCRIGTNSIVGASTLVTHNALLPPNSIIFGSPYKIIRELHADEIEAIHQSALRYHKLAQKYLSASGSSIK